MEYDLLIKGGTVCDPARNVCKTFDVAVAGPTIKAVGRSISESQSKAVVSAKGLWVTPGLIDFHAHVFWKGNPFSVDPDVCLEDGVTTVVDAGTAGASNYPAFRDYVIAHSKIRIFAYLNISIIGQPFFVANQNIPKNEFLDIRFASVHEAVRVAREDSEHIKGIKVRLVGEIPWSQGVAPLQLALEAARELKLPIMVHLGAPPPLLEEILPLLRKGDSLTHIYRSWPNCVLQDGRIRDSIVRAKDRGIALDVGHGYPQLDLVVAREAISQGLKPDTISTDLTSFNRKRIVYSLCTTMSKFLAMGMGFQEVLHATTTRPSQLLGVESTLGSLDVGSVADIAILDIEEGEFVYEDYLGETVKAQRRIRNVCTIRGGKIIYQDPRHEL